ncbi:MAG: 50S ribosomal protein L18 [Ignavibacteriota bacterium]|jgi:large subunit ribosomal protein L18|nr:MAG: 50S ribosomal protein L18 [Chlorobiota bacterium]MBE7476962.1 50S ribosomal protein L18 [Ignavibacteriales bacterium]MBL1121788.1 50S ribosomal protein L18 [Ignavibacteriota bacterium]MBV6419851.1 50S ribosomal protein L18 [Ignavibacteriaceae bacterium]MCE7855322.1 50S ribosomal protein L18 [Ignavibacteria bacterium CHB3]MEB2295617.1 50S ribosomal protein L18 [Ignavibacteria bacterium]
MKKKTSRTRSRIKIRKKISGTTEKPRLSVYRSLDNIYAQIIDDSTGNTLVAMSSLNKEAKTEVKSVKGKINKSKLIGSMLAKKALEKNIKSVVFDRGGFRYHGRVKALADGAREGGLAF